MRLFNSIRNRLLQATHKQITWLLLVVSFLYYASFFNYGLDLDDEGFLLANASSILDGLWPMADYFSYQPLSYFILAGFFGLFGDNVLSERLMLVCLLLGNVWLIFFCARKILPLRWAWLPVAVYAFAPGPWYKVFFISHMLLSLAAALYFIEKPNFKRAFTFGISCGLATISRIHSGELIFLMGWLLIILIPFAPSQQILETVSSIPSKLKRAIGLAVPFVTGTAVVITLTGIAYGLVGKFPTLLANILHYYNPAAITTFLYTLSGRGASFTFSKLFEPHSLEMWVYASAMLICLANLLRYGRQLLTSRTDEQNTLVGFTIALFGVASLGYTYFFVWNSRMLSSFAIVYINYFLFFSYVSSHTSLQHTHKLAQLIRYVCFVFIAVYLINFIRVQNYSGSYTTKSEGMIQIKHPKLNGIYVYPGQDETILKLTQLIKTSNSSDYLIPMSEATTLGYLSGLENPTYYRLFLSEFAPAGEEARAIEQFENQKIRYFVARRSQFLGGPMIGSDLSKYAPNIRAYLLANYRVSELGLSFVLLERN